MNRPRHPAPRLSTMMSRGWRPVEPPRRPVLFVNPRSGDGAATRNRVVERASERGVEAVTLGPGDDLRTRVLEVVADGADALGVAGGDGSLAVVAAVAAAHGLPFVCIPVGTRNHFALDLGVDRQDVPGALDAFMDGVERLIDVGEVNGRIFLNNASLGIYGEAVRQAAYRDTKVRTLAETARRVLGPSGRMPALRLVDDTGREHARLAVLLVSNNPYAAWSRHSTDARQRSAGDPGARHTRGEATPSWASLERSSPRGPSPSGCACRHRWRGGRACFPAGVLRPPCGTAGPDLRAPSGRLAGSPDPIPRVTSSCWATVAPARRVVGRVSPVPPGLLESSGRTPFRSWLLFRLQQWRPIITSPG